MVFHTICLVLSTLHKTFKDTCEASKEVVIRTCKINSEQLDFSFYSSSKLPSVSALKWSFLCFFSPVRYSLVMHAAVAAGILGCKFCFWLQFLKPQNHTRTLNFTGVDWNSKIILEQFQHSSVFYTVTSWSI